MIQGPSVTWPARFSQSDSGRRISFGSPLGSVGLGHRLDHDAKARQLHVVQVQPPVVVAKQVGVDGPVEELASDGERAERTLALGHADRLVDRVVEEEPAGDRVPPDVRRPDVPLARAKDHRTPLPVDQVRRGVDAVAVVAVDLAGGVEVIDPLVQNDRRIGQVPVDHRVAVGRPVRPPNSLGPRHPYWNANCLMRPETAVSPWASFRHA
jgi:hypothetical protein